MENPNTITVELSAEQIKFLTDWQKTHESELGIEVPIGAMVRKAVDGAMKAAAKPREDRPPRKPFGDKPPARGGFKPAGRGPKFSMTGPKNKTREF